MRRQVEVKKRGYCEFTIEPPSGVVADKTNGHPVGVSRPAYPIYLVHERSHRWSSLCEPVPRTEASQTIPYLASCSFNELRECRGQFRPGIGQLGPVGRPNTSSLRQSNTTDYDSALMTALHDIGFSSGREEAKTPSIKAVINSKDISKHNLEGVNVGDGWTIENGKFVRRKPATPDDSDNGEVPLEL